MTHAEKGMVTWEGLKEELESYSKETLVELVSTWISNYWTCHSYWVTYVERDFGVENATRLDGEVFAKNMRVQAKKFTQMFGLGHDMQALAFLLKHTSLQWVPYGFEWEFGEITEHSMTVRVMTCPMGTFRKPKGLELYPCRIIALPIYIALANTVNPNIKCECVHAHPDAAIEGTMCEWRFTLEE